jgi:hypothetical protein
VKENVVFDVLGCKQTGRSGGDREKNLLNRRE